MWKPLLLLGCALALGACATTETDPLEKIGREKPRIAASTCLAQVGTHIKKPGRCVNAPGRVYGNGGADVLGAWWQDPAIRIGH